ncbi:MAG: SDR family oxidoreductase [Sphingomonadales bacterium]|nr:SDR family oxidoreductase [Sphingomonadales bacterium]
MTKQNPGFGAALVACHGAMAAAERVALVTGATGAMGRAIVDRLANKGSGVVITDRDSAQLEAFARELFEGHGVPVIAIAADLLNVDAVQAMVPLIDAHAGRLDHLVNNAGLNRPQSLEEATLDDWEAVFAINLRVPMLLAKAAIPLWRRQGGGAIVNIGSRVWLSGAVPAYTASKAGLVGLTRSLAVELGPIGVTANVVAPSFVDTPFTRQNRSQDEIAAMHARALEISPVPRLGRAEDIAGTVAFLLSPDASYITGEVIHVCGGAQMAARSTNPVKVMEG